MWWDNGGEPELVCSLSSKGVATIFSHGGSVKCPCLVTQAPFLLTKHNVASGEYRPSRPMGTYETWTPYDMMPRFIIV